MRVSISAFLFAICFAVSLAIGGPIPLTNFSFEEPDVENGNFTPDSPTLPGWSRAASEGFGNINNPIDAQFPNATSNVTPLPGTADGWQALRITVQTSNLTTRVARWRQETGEIITANTEYLLKVAVGNPLDAASEFAQIQFTTNGRVLAITDVTAPDGTFADNSLLFDVLPGNPQIGKPLAIDLQMVVPQGPSGNEFRVYFDNVRLEAIAIPEPTMMAAMMLCCGVMRRRARRQPAPAEVLSVPRPAP